MPPSYLSIFSANNGTAQRDQGEKKVIGSEVCGIQGRRKTDIGSEVGGIKGEREGTTGAAVVGV